MGHVRPYLPSTARNVFSANEGLAALVVSPVLLVAGTGIATGSIALAESAYDDVNLLGLFAEIGCIGGVAMALQLLMR